MRVVALAGGVGGAKLAHGLRRSSPRVTCSVIVNTGDDCERHGLLVCPTTTRCSTRWPASPTGSGAGGSPGETWSAMDQLGGYGEETWFGLGDRDLALHIVRTARAARRAPA